MILPRDIVALVAVARASEGWTVRSLGLSIGSGPSPLHRSLERLAAVRLYSPTTRRINAALLEEFLRHGLLFVLDRRLGASSRGVPTAWGVEPLASLMAHADAVPVWPSAHGTIRGPALKPLVDNAVELIDAAPDIATDLALIDAIRVGGARDRRLATDLLLARLAVVEVAS